MAEFGDAGRLDASMKLIELQANSEPQDRLVCTARRQSMAEVLE
jgi:hypothetical protein